MAKKVLKGFGIFFLVIIVALATIPFLFKDKIKELVITSLNEKLNADIAFADVDLSLLKNFPNASITISNLSVINKAPFKGDTLFYAKNLYLKMNARELLKSKNLIIESFTAEKALVNIHTNKDGVANYAITKEDATTETTEEVTTATTNEALAFTIEEYSIINSRILYTDESSKIAMALTDFNHKGKGDFATQQLDLATTSSTNVSFSMEETNYMENIKLSLEATLGVNLDNMTFTFKENKALINQLPLAFDGYMQIKEQAQVYKLTFETPTSSFKNFLGLVPEIYAENTNNVKTNGDFAVNGKIDGELTETTIPTFAIQLSSNNASFKYPDLPKEVKNIHIDTKIINTTGNIDATFVQLNKLSFAIDKDVFNAKATVRNITKNPTVKAELKGTINLGNIKKAYPVKMEQNLEGILKANVVTSFDMQAVEKNNYKNIKNTGNISLSNFKYEGEEVAKPFYIKTTTIHFTPNQIKLNEFNATTGKSDLQISGNLDNLYGFLFKEQELKGNFKALSSTFVVSDFMSPTETTSTSTEETSASDKATATTEAIKIPSFLNCNLTAEAKTVLYDDLTLKNVTGNLKIKDEIVTLSNLKMNAFDGSIQLNGTVSTKENTPTFNMGLKLDKVNIASSFTQLEMLKNIAPIANTINGKLNSNITLSGDLKNDMTPNLKTLSGDLIGQLLSTTINENNSQLLSSLSSKLNFLDISKLNLNDVKASLSFKDGKVALKPTTLKYKDVGININGTHSFDQNMNYNVTFDVPVEYLGKEVNSLVSKLSTSDKEKLKNIPITANLTGFFNKPVVKTDLTSATKNVTTQLIQLQKEKLLNQGVDALGNLLGGNKNDTTTTSDSTQTEENTPKENIKEGIKSVLGGFLNKKKKE